MFEAHSKASRTTPDATSFKSWIAHLIGKTCAIPLRLLALSWRTERTQLVHVDRIAAEGTPVVAVFWHGSYLPLFALASGRQIRVFTNQSFRGQVIASICQAFGYDPFLLPLGQTGYHAMRAVLSEHSGTRSSPLIFAIAVDGPLGPAHTVRSGAVHIAARLGAVIVPVSVESRPSWTIKSRWDHFRIPLPGATVRIRLGAAIPVPDSADRDQNKQQAIKRLIFEQLQR